ncbi:hypothetical protein SAMN05216548_11913 [Faunimonas pinastri]|uniref:Uncharacterized protein n=1 Tax=Faunimonas pinastri TaxID=1855383 RepID=A0A1H9P9P2_9HYPH|nr:hypothetical protein [Faunimonas pinastri]SER44827.1 hypothetical protein SAMN05216548_11913 [Faunimonas pinastri]
MHSLDQIEEGLRAGSDRVASFSFHLLRSSLIVGAAFAIAAWHDRRRGERAGERQDASAANAALDPADPAASLPPGTYGQVRAAGPESMRDGDVKRWDQVDEGSDESFPASDPPAY